MAKSITDVDPQQGPSNSDARVAAHRALLKKMIPIEEKIDKLKTEMKKARNDWKASTNMSLADFDAARRLATIEDDDDRRAKLTDLVEIFNELAPGETLNFLESAHYADGEP